MATGSTSPHGGGGVARRLPPRARAAAERGFFDEPDAWKELEESVVEPLVGATQPGEAIRVWVPAAGTGEDAYGVAMLFVERLEAELKRALLTVFATDEDGAAIEQARAGAYSAAVVTASGVSGARAFFSREMEASAI
jgi:two-component system CheB/CheR fusion protein